MTKAELISAFKIEENFHDVKSLTIPQTTTYSDLDAFLLLDRLVSSEPVTHGVGHRRDMVSCAEHDQIWLNVDLDRLAAAATLEDVANLQRLGVMLDSSTDSLSVFV